MLPSKILKYVLFDQESARASDGIRISYDYDRDGYKIEQASQFASPDNDGGHWQEVAFILTLACFEAAEPRPLQIDELEEKSQS